MPGPVDSREIRETASEIKFAVDLATGDRIRERARALLSPDPCASGPHADEYDSTTLYFDTGDYAVYNRRGSFRRAKYRIRRYGQGDFVFLERKLRTSELLSKRRTSIRLNDLPLLTATSPDADWRGRWFHERVLMRRLSPVCQIAYRRTARVGTTDHGSIRLTVDDKLGGWPVDKPAFGQPCGLRLLTSQIIVELKFRAGMPAVFKRIVEEFALQPVRISKYRLGIEATRPEIAATAKATAEALQGSDA